MEVAPNVYQLKLPMPNPSLEWANCYLLKTSDGCLLIDAGWDTDGAFEALCTQVAEAGARLGDIRYIVITHVHPDHYGLAGRLKKHTDAELILHKLERSLLDSRYIHPEELLTEMDEWLEINGVPSDVRPEMKTASLPLLNLVGVAMPDAVVRGGEHLVVGDFDLEVIWTPGHSPGHINLYDRSRRILYSGDHVLPKITSGVSMHSQSISNPLVDYHNSLTQVAQLDVETVLSGHGEPLHDLAERVRKVEERHARRLAQVRSLCGVEPKTAYDVAREIRWHQAWDRLPNFSKRAAVTETVARLELLLARGAVSKSTGDGLMRYRAAE